MLVIGLTPNPFAIKPPIFHHEMCILFIDGIEVFSSCHDAQDTKRYLEVAKEMNCFVSVGSGYCGNGEIGNTNATDKFEKVIRVLIDRCLKMVEKKD